VLEVFQECPTLEEFERKLNSEDLNINNLDLDGDGNVDFIQVEDNVVGTSHSIVLKVAINSTEWQDDCHLQNDHRGGCTLAGHPAYLHSSGSTPFLSLVLFALPALVASVETPLLALLLGIPLPPLSSLLRALPPLARLPQSGGTPSLFCQVPLSISFCV
jgi:hypothetical protein